MELISWMYVVVGASFSFCIVVAVTGCVAHSHRPFYQSFADETYTRTHNLTVMLAVLLVLNVIDHQLLEHFYFVYKDHILIIY